MGTAVIEGTSDPFLDMTNHQAKAEHGDGDGNTPPSVASFIAAKPAAPTPAEVPDLLDMGDLLTSFDAPENMNAYPLQQQSSSSSSNCIHLRIIVRTNGISISNISS